MILIDDVEEVVEEVQPCVYETKLLQSFCILTITKDVPEIFNEEQRRDQFIDAMNVLDICARKLGLNIKASTFTLKEI